MILLDKDAAEVALQVLALTLDGEEKTDVASGTVRVYRQDDSDLLPAAALSRVGTTSVWRLLWAPASLPVGNYFAEFRLADSFGSVAVTLEDLVVRDFADNSGLANLSSQLTGVGADVEVIRKVETGRWKIAGNQMTFYDDDGTTPLLVFDLKDDTGLPSSERVFERVRS